MPVLRDLRWCRKMRATWRILSQRSGPMVDGALERRVERQKGQLKASAVFEE